MPSERKHAKLTEKQVIYLTDRFYEVFDKHNPVLWKPEALTDHMQNHEVSGKFLFLPEEFLQSSQIRSFFSRLSVKKELKSAEENENEDGEDI